MPAAPSSTSSPSRAPTRRTAPLFEFYRDKALNANDAINVLNNRAKSPYHYNQFGGSFGGPFQRDQPLPLRELRRPAEHAAERRLRQRCRPARAWIRPARLVWRASPRLAAAMTRGRTRTSSWSRPTRSSSPTSRLTAPLQPSELHRQELRERRARRTRSSTPATPTCGREPSTPSSRAPSAARS